MDLGDDESNEMLADAESRKPWFRQAWFTKIVAPLVVIGVAGFFSMFFLLRSNVQAAKVTANQADEQAAKNSGRIEQLRKNRQEFEKKVIESLSGIETQLHGNQQELERLRSDVRDHRNSHH